MTRLLARLRAAWSWYLDAVRTPHRHAYDQRGECECGKWAGDW